MVDLVDLKALSIKLKKDFAQNFKEGDCTLPIEFKEKVKRINSFSLIYDDYTVVFSGNGANSLNSYIPNQLFYVAAFFADYTKELFKYKELTLGILSNAGLQRDSYQSFFTDERDNGKRHLKENNDRFAQYLEQQNIQNPNKSYLLKFVTDYDWWGGAKTIDRNDFYNSGVLSTIGVTASSNSTLANICGFLAENPDCLSLLNNHNRFEPIEKDGQDEVISLPDCEIIHKDGKWLFKFRFPYKKEDFMKETFLTEEETDEIITILKRNKNIILQGAPGVGKTWTAKRIAYLMMGGVDEDRIQTVQFHQTYSYDSFIEGYRPDEGSFHLEPGVFRDFCKKAAEDEYKRDYFFIIDEINRGNISKIMGEVLSLIEVGYRGKEHSMKLSYNSEFYVPENLYIIGMMNTADRSLSIIDYALRRRFAFISMTPKFDSEGFKSFNSAIHNPKYKKVIDAVIDLNKEISDDPALGKGFEIGHSYFCLKNEVKDTELLTILKYQIIPMIREYWFDNPSKAEEEAKKLLESVK